MNRVARMSMKAVGGALALFSAFASISQAIADPHPEKLTQAPDLRDSVKISAHHTAAQDLRITRSKRSRAPASVRETRAGPVTLRANTGPDDGMLGTTATKSVYRTSK